MMIALLMLLVVRQGAGSNVWSVTLADPDLCVATGSSVVLQCSYDYPDGQTVRKATWSKGVQTDGQWTRVELSLIPTYRNRSEYLGDLQHDCRLALSELEESDSGYYYFRFDTDTYGWRSRKSLYLIVTDVKARVHPAQVETESKVTLECLTSCEHRRVVWFKDGEPLSQPEFQARPQDSGYYACALEGQESALSHPVALDVQYRHVNVSISTHPSRVMAGSGVNLTCSSDSNPTAYTYTWYRKTHPTGSMQQVGSGQLLSLLAVEASHSGLYLCQARNQLGEGNSTELLLTVEEETDHRPLNVSISMHPPNVTAGGGVNLTCSSDSNPAADNYTWYRKTHPTGSMQQVGSGQLLSLLAVEASHSGLYLCQARNQLGEGNSTELLLTVEEETDHGGLILLISFGVKIVIILSLTLALIWAWRGNSTVEVSEEIGPDNEYVYDSISCEQ
ncbi:B-cell receptor CD22-like [Nelusetta ayraudi]|uniref:B-cell receptor CD22-like n=1 Tax=Nelusetta ayraudi TaxID=303726 RepID=UPI003F716C82